MGLWLFAAVLALAWVVELPRHLTLAICALLWAAILLVHLLAPASPLAGGIGGSARGWLVAGGAAALVLAYRGLLRRLRGRAGHPAQASAEDAAPSPDGPLSDAELDRYARHLVLREIGGTGQMRLRKARVLVVGAGGLGAPVCLYLAAAGVGRITLADDDRVSLSNLQRQVIFRSRQRGMAKSAAAADAMTALNPHIAVTALSRRIGTDDTDLIAGHDLVIDGTDSFASRAAINRACVAAATPLIAGAIAQWEGQVSLYDPARGGPCFACLFPDPPAAGLAPTCAEAGVVGALPGVVGSLMTLEAIKHLTGIAASGAGQDLRRRMLIFDGLYGETRLIHISRRTDCPVCAEIARPD